MNRNNDIKEDYVSFETAKLLKRNGFGVKSLAVYNSEGDFIDKLYRFDGQLLKNCILAPTQQMALKWIRENFKIYIDITSAFDSKGINVIFKYMSFNDEMDIVAKSDYQFPTYEEAVENSIIHTLMNLNI